MHQPLDYEVSTEPAPALLTRGEKIAVCVVLAYAIIVNLLAVVGAAALWRML
jgi:hypothetical protein